MIATFINKNKKKCVLSVSMAIIRVLIKIYKKIAKIMLPFMRMNQN